MKKQNKTIFFVVISVIGIIFRLPPRLQAGLFAFMLGLPLSYNAYALVAGKTAIQGTLCYTNAISDVANADPYTSRDMLKQPKANLLQCVGEIDSRKSTFDVYSDFKQSTNR